MRGGCDRKRPLGGGVRVALLPRGVSKTNLRVQAHTKTTPITNCGSVLPAFHRIVPRAKNADDVRKLELAREAVVLIAWALQEAPFETDQGGRILPAHGGERAIKGTLRGCGWPSLGETGRRWGGYSFWGWAPPRTWWWRPRGRGQRGRHGDPPAGRGRPGGRGPGDGPGRGGGALLTGRRPLLALTAGWPAAILLEPSEAPGSAKAWGA